MGLLIEYTGISYRWLFDAIIDEYLGFSYTIYQRDIRRLAKANWLVARVTKFGGWEGGSAERRRYKGVWIMAISYVAITLALLIIVGIY